MENAGSREILTLTIARNHHGGGNFRKALVVLQGNGVVIDSHAELKPNHLQLLLIICLGCLVNPFEWVGTPFGNLEVLPGLSHTVRD